MEFFDILLISVGLSMDNMAVAAASSCHGKSYPLKTNFKVASVFCLIGIICLLLGWFGGLYLERYINFWDHWVAFFILLYVGGKMVLSFLKAENTQEPYTYDLIKIRALIILALATNIDVFAIGLTLSFYKVSLLLVLTVLTICVGLFTLLGFTLGKKLGILVGKKAEFIGGVILIGIGLKILIQGLLSA